MLPNTVCKIITEVGWMEGTGAPVFPSLLFGHWSVSPRAIILAVFSHWIDIWTQELHPNCFPNFSFELVAWDTFDGKSSQVSKRCQAYHFCCRQCQSCQIYQGDSSVADGAIIGVSDSAGKTALICSNCFALLDPSWFRKSWRTSNEAVGLRKAFAKTKVGASCTCTYAVY